MRLSTREGDAGFVEWARLKHEDRLAQIRVLLNGEQQKHVVVADEEQGYIERAMLGADGHVLLNPLKDRVMEERVEGEVRIVLAEPVDADQG